MPSPLFVYLSSTGRISRLTYWVYSVPIVLLYWLMKHWEATLNAWFYLAGLLLLLFPGMMINIKRSHDRGRSGWFSLLLLVPIISIWPLVELGFLKGDEEENDFGDSAIW